MKKLIVSLSVLLLLFGYNSIANAEVYLDLGFTYVDDVNVVSSTRLRLLGHDVTAEVNHTLEVDNFVPMIRIGYMYKGFAIEYDTIGVPDLVIPRINTFYRLKFK